MRAMILAGGLSTRLYPLTKQVPKPLVPVAGKPNAEHLIRYLASFGYREIVINVHYLADAILARLGDGSGFGVRLTYSHEDELLGSAGAVKKVQDFFAGEPSFVVVGCDDLTNLPLDDLLAFHRKNEAVATIGLVERSEVEHYGVVVTDERGRITGFQEKPPRGTERSHAVNTGIYAFSPKIFDEIPPQAFYDFGKQVFPALQERGAAFYGFDAGDAYWCDIGTVGEYWRASDDVLGGRVTLPGMHATGVRKSTRVGKGVRIEGHVLFGHGVILGDDVTIAGPTSLGDAVTVDSGARVEHSVLWDGAHVGANATLRHAIVGMNYTVPESALLRDAVVANEEAAEAI
ncbi:MAG: NDP-sugar synthase [Candidatus Eremiobacteraeota bacterium]|nr:NDP-sugar synthase [Candidatus Eremiobacteraeota bacterium]